MQAGSELPRIAVLISGNGTTLQNLIDRSKLNELCGTIVLVISSKPQARGIARAEAAGIPTAVILRKENPQSFSERVFTAIRAAQCDLVLLGGWLQHLTIPADFQGRVLNIHPSLLPKFGGHGMYGHHVHEAVLAAGETRSGCTVHFVDDQYDSGPIILQREVPVLPGDTPDRLAERVFEQECQAYPEALEQVWRTRANKVQ
jgi:phosphoribosylglycinamide formyltransferase-1